MVNNVNGENENFEVESSGVAAFDETQEQPKAKRESVSSQKNMSRRGLLGAAVAVIAGAGGAVALPYLSSSASESKAATVDDIAQLEYELSMLTKSSADAELLSHKTTTIDENSTDVQYPSSKAVYDAMGDKIDIHQGEEYAGYIFIVNENGKLELSQFTSDELNETSVLPVQNKVVYKALKDIMRALSNLDSYPTKDSERGVESNGVYETYQETKEVTSLSGIEMGINYKYTGKAIGSTEDTWSIKRIDSVLIAVSHTDPSLVYTSTDDGASWGAPYGGW